MDIASTKKYKKKYAKKFFYTLISPPPFFLESFASGSFV